jgi:hypothetical protein
MILINMFSPANDNNSNIIKFHETGGKNSWDLSHFAASIHAIMHPGSMPWEKVNKSLKSIIIDPRLISNKREAANDAQDLNKVKRDDTQEFFIDRDTILQIWMRLLNGNESITIEEVNGLFSDLLIYGLSEIHSELSLERNQKYSPIEAAAYLDNALSLLESTNKIEEPEYQILLIWKKIIGKNLWVPEEKWFEFIARMLERLQNKKAA